MAQVDSPAIKRRFGPYIEQMVTLLKAPDITAELFVEVLGSLANLYIPEFDFLGLARKHDLLSFLATYSQVGADPVVRCWSDYEIPELACKSTFYPSIGTLAG